MKALVINLKNNNMADTIKVTATQTHHGAFGTIKAGDTYETDKLHAQELVNNGLVTAPGITPTTPKDGFVSDINVQMDKPKEKAENKTGNVPTAKKNK